MINIKIDNEYLDLYPDTVIQRERNSPFFLSKSGGGDSIPGETSYPFDVPPTDKNLRLLGHPNVLAANRKREYDCLLYDNIAQISGGKLQLRNFDWNLNKNGIGKMQGVLLSNSSAFGKLIEGKLLKDLDLGGSRTFTADTNFYPVSGGFFHHMVSTWSYTDCDDGDYVFFPVKNLAYLGLSDGYVNPMATLFNSSYSTLGMWQYPNSYCPHIYMVYLIKQVFNEMGYTVSGEILEDADFKKLCMISLYGVRWCDIDYTTDGEIDSLNPLSSVTIKVNEHVPPKWTIGKFLIELQKFLPIGFDICDRKRHCTIRTLGKPVSAAQKKDVTNTMTPDVSITLSDNKTAKTVIALTRNFGADEVSGNKVDIENTDYFSGRDIAALPLPIIAPEGAVYKVQNENSYYTKVNINGILVETEMGDNTGDYKPPDFTETIECAIVPVGSKQVDLQYMLQNQDANYAAMYDIPYMEAEGNWNGKPEQTDWGMHVCFYRGRTYPLRNNNAKVAPYATHTNSKWVVGSGAEEIEQEGSWCLGFENGSFGMVEIWWREWLKILSEQETIKGTLLLTLPQYLQLSWGDELLIENTSYVLKRIDEVLPFAGKVNFEAVRWIK